MRRDGRNAYAGWVCVAILLGCGDGRGATSEDAGVDARDGGTVGVIDAGRERVDLAPVDPRCVAPAGAPTAPGTIAEAAALLNALPKPVTLSCFVEALARPLSLQAVDSVFSAQPAQGRRSPRVFVFFPGLTISVVPDGPGAMLLELGEAREENQSLKAELEFPIESELDDAAPFQRVHYDDAITTCGFCHQGERRAEEQASPLAFVSPALRPRDNQRVPLDELRAEVAVCDADAEPDRCALLRALFGRPPDPIGHEFPAGYKFFF